MMPSEERTGDNDVFSSTSERFATRRQALTHCLTASSVALAGCGGRSNQATNTQAEEKGSAEKNDSPRTTTPGKQEEDPTKQFIETFTASEYEESAEYLSQEAERSIRNKVLGFRQLQLSDTEDVLHRLNRSILSQHGEIKDIDISRSESRVNEVTLYHTNTNTELEIKCDKNKVEDISIRSSYSSPAYITSDQFDNRSVTFERDGTAHEGTLTTPTTDGPAPLVILAQGAGNYDQDSTIGPNKLFADLARGLAKYGVAVYRFDRTTPQQIPTYTPSEAYTPDIENALDRVLSEPGIRDDAVYLVGHSMGGMWAPHVASVEDRISGIGILDSYAFDFLDGFKFSLRALREQEFRTDREKALASRLIRSVKEIRDNGVTPDNNLGFPQEWLKENIEYDHTRTAARLGKPVFVLLKGRGPLPASKEESNLGLWNTYLNVWHKGRENNAIIHNEKINHYLQHGFGPSTMTAKTALHDNVSNGVTQSLAQWVLNAAE